MAYDNVVCELNRKIKNIWFFFFLYIYNSNINSVKNGRKAKSISFIMCGYKIDFQFPFNLPRENGKPCR